MLWPLATFAQVGILPEVVLDKCLFRDRDIDLIAVLGNFLSKEVATFGIIFFVSLMRNCILITKILGRDFFNNSNGLWCAREAGGTQL